MRHKVKFDRWVAISYNYVTKKCKESTDLIFYESVLDLISSHEDYYIRRNKKDIATRVTQLLHAPKGPHQIGKVKSKKKRVVKM